MIWSFILTAIGILGLWLTTRKSRWGFAIGVLAQVLWFSYAMVTRQYGFVLSASLFGVLYGRGWWKWSKEPPK